MSKAKINEFLLRARKVSSEADRIQKSQSPITAKRPSTRLSYSPHSPSPVSQHSFTSEKQNSPNSSSMNKNPFKVMPRKKNSVTPTPIAKKLNLFQQSENNSNKFGVIVEKIEKYKKEFTKEIQNHAKVEETVATNLINNLKQQKKALSQDPKIKQIEERYKGKTDQILEIFRAEALKTDSKLKALQMENEKLKSIQLNPQLPQTKKKIVSVKEVLHFLSSNPSNSEYLNTINDLCLTCRKSTDSKYLEKSISNWFDCLRIDSGHYKVFLATLSKRVLEEQAKRLKSEEETNRMMEYEEKLIENLEFKVKIAEAKAKKHSGRYPEDLKESPVKNQLFPSRANENLFIQ